MGQTSSRDIAETYYRASTQRDIETALSVIDDNVDWLVRGPIDVFPFLGQRHGRHAVREGYREIARKLEMTGYEIDALLIDGDHSAAMIHITAIIRATSRRISVRTSQFARYRGGKMIEMRALIDTYDMVEQTLGRGLGVARPEIEKV